MQVPSPPVSLDQESREPRLEAGPAGICMREHGWLDAQPRLRPLAQTRKGAQMRRRDVTLMKCSRVAGPAPSLKPEKCKALEGRPQLAWKRPSVSCLARLRAAELPAPARLCLSDDPALSPVPEPRLVLPP